MTMAILMQFCLGIQLQVKKRWIPTLLCANGNKDRLWLHFAVLYRSLRNTYPREETPNSHVATRGSMLMKKIHLKNQFVRKEKLPSNFRIKELDKDKNVGQVNQVSTLV